ncbi:protein FAF-like, chloroplastic [Benincasa hispida]|uniref:protein FAF-like, chloroplastic n=1 Tax=Benincasa hispida TaxID=102211 RepID=UPI0018FFA889|nr:protein FAF-like, chloroplastic [Benincasa hispida]
MSPLKSFQASYSDKKQGIVAVLSSDSEHSQIQPSSLRRTLSADMSSQKWISYMKKVASFHEFHTPKTEHETEDEAEGVDVWSSIIKESRQDSKPVSDPYVHPLLKRSGKCLSEKSLEICTESLGSETGSDGFSSYPSSENGDTDDEEENILEGTQIFEVENQWKRVKISYKKSPPHRSFPPPLPTLSGPDGESLRMQPRRDNGRLVLEAMSVPSQNNFRAQRQDGRLVLTLLNRHPINQVVKDDDSDKEEEKEEEKEKDPKLTKSSEFASGLVKIHRLASMMNSKTIALANRNPSLPPRPKAAQPLTGCAAPPTAATLNAYEYYWKSKPTGKVGTGMNPLGQQPASFKSSSRKVMICKNRTANEEEKLVVMCSNGSCKEVRRTVVFWEPRCIATS